jgi:radical SAM superfamily enzyme YgiQ (UPF0313 family)
MPVRTPEQIKQYLDRQQYRFDLPAQYYGDEPNSYRKPFDEAEVTWWLGASWPYEAAAGNQSVPSVYQAINEHSFALCDRWYLPSTPRDMRLFAKAGIPVFGIESKHQIRDFDVVSTSIAYPILVLSFHQYLKMSDIPVRWADREARGLENYPMILIGGQVYGAPETIAPMCDAIWLGEVEDEPGNGGIGQVLSRIRMFKDEGLWQTDRLECYRRLALEFNYLYFPRFVETTYEYEDRRHVGCELPSKQVVSIRSTLTGQRMPFLKRIVKDMDAVKPLVNLPLLYSDPAMGAGDLEVGRGCPAWCSFCALCLSGDTKFVSRSGVTTLAEAAGETHEVWTSSGWVKADIAQQGVDRLNTITFEPAFLGWSEYAQRLIWKKRRGEFSVTHRATALHRWPLAGGGETHHLAVGDFVQAEFTKGVGGPDYDAGWVHGLVFGDGYLENSHLGDRSNCYGAYVRVDAPDHLVRFSALQCDRVQDHSGCGRPVCVVSVTQVSDQLYRVRMNSRDKLKQLPSSVDFASEHIRGFIEGWDAADGNERSRRDDRLKVNSQHPAAEQWLRENAAYGGWVLVGMFERSSLETNYGTRKNPMREFTLSRVTAWKVTAIEEGTEPEPVYCATVPGVGFWTLASGVYTGNTYRQKPYRQRTVDYMVKFAQEFQRNVGGVNLAPFMPDFPMHTQRKTLIKNLLEKVSDEVDAAAMRVDDFIADSQFVLVQVYGGMDHVTLGLEGNSQRMRDLIGKGTGDEDVREAVTTGIRAGIRKFKFFMISNMPGEDEGDIFRILRLAKDLADIRDNLGQPNVRIQFSWTPLLIEANTPMQWFAPTIGSRALSDVWEEFKSLKIEFKLGSKTEPNKAAYFQCCQRSSRDVGEALVDVMDDLNQACWGGMPKHTKALLEDKLRARGFHNALADTFDERFKNDMFGWEHIDQGVSTELMWVTYQQMREFLTDTDSHTYDLAFDQDYHGNEWIARCDTQCQGKAQPLDAKVLTPSGWMRMGDVAVGQEVTDPEGACSVVTGVYPQGVLPVYRVGFSDGTSAEASGDHLWDVYHRKGKRQVRSTVTTDTLCSWVGTWRSPRLVDAPGLALQDFPESGVTVDPYLLGLMLGDGSMTRDHTPTFGSADAELLEYVRSQLTVTERGFRTGAYWLSLPGFARPLRELGVFGLTCYTKHVPEQYKWASAKTRLAVLQGLMDTDGCREAWQTARFSSASRQLRDDVAWLARSLGLPALLYEKQTSHSTAYGVRVLETEGVRVFRLPRKLRELGGSRRSCQRRVVSVEHVRDTECQCIMVSAPSQLYVTDDFTPTHNTCGVCDFEDLRLRTQYVRAAQQEEDIDLSRIIPINQTSKALLIRCRVEKNTNHRFVMNDHFRFAARRAAYQAQHDLQSPYGVSKRSVRFGSDAFKIKDWTAGRDYLEFGVTKRMTRDQIQEFIDRMNYHFLVDKDDPGSWIMRLTDWRVHPGTAANMSTDVDLSLYDLELDVEPSVLLGHLARYREASYVRLAIKQDTGYFTPGIVEVNAKDYVRDMWLRRDEDRLLLRILVRGAPSPYQVYAALTGKMSWLDAASKPAMRVDMFVDAPEAQGDFLRPSCLDCGLQIPTNILDEPYDPDRCPKCKDRHDGTLVDESALIGA